MQLEAALVRLRRWNVWQALDLEISWKRTGSLASSRSSGAFAPKPKNSRQPPFALEGAGGSGRTDRASSGGAVCGAESSCFLSASTRASSGAVALMSVPRSGSAKKSVSGPSGASALQHHPLSIRANLRADGRPLDPREAGGGLRSPPPLPPQPGFVPPGNPQFPFTEQPCPERTSFPTGITRCTSVPKAVCQKDYRSL